MVRSERKKAFAIDDLFNKSLGSYRSLWTMTSIARAGSSESAGGGGEGAIAVVECSWMPW
jgi:hypothetical protein